MEPVIPSLWRVIGSGRVAFMRIELERHNRQILAASAG
jgi:hypothetical protein